LLKHNLTAKSASLQQNDLIPMAYCVALRNPVYTLVKSRTKQNATLIIHFFSFFILHLRQRKGSHAPNHPKRKKNNPYTNIQSTKIPSFYSLHPGTNEKSSKSLLFIKANRLQYRTGLFCCIVCPLPSIVILP
jgi:hypothetical protein